MAAANKKKKEEPKRARATQKLTVTQAKLVETQFDTWAKKGTDLGAKLLDIESRFEDKDKFVPAQVSIARAKLVEALTLADEAREEFAKINEQYRSFFG